MKCSSYIAFTSLIAMLAVPAQATDRIAISKAVFIEQSSDNDGWRALAPAKALKSGDRVVLMIEWTGTEARKGHVVTSAIPAAVAFQRSSATMMEVSADGGRSYGLLGKLRHEGRRASPEEVTHIRVKLRGTNSGRMTYSAIVR